MIWVGIDFGSKLAGTTVIAFAKKEQIHFLQSKKKQDADQMISTFLEKEKPNRVFIDAPLSLPKVYRKPTDIDDFFYREADRDLKAMSPMFLGGLTARAMRLVAQNQKLIEVEFFEAYPGFLAKCLHLSKLEYKKEAQYLKPLTDQITDYYDLTLAKMPANWHQFDALLAYISGLRYRQGQHLTFGDPDEGLIII